VLSEVFRGSFAALGVQLLLATSAGAQKSKHVKRSRKPQVEVLFSPPKKRKSDSASLSKPGSSKVSRQTLDSFFTPRVSVSSGNRNDTTLLTLNEEQRRVLTMVVDEGKNVFFTGSAGVSVLSLSARQHPLFLLKFSALWQERENHSCFAQSSPPSARNTPAGRMPYP
jgi:hypothetical protein